MLSRESRAGRKEADLSTETTNTTSDAVSIWREKTSDEITPVDLVAIGDLLRNTALIGEPKWKVARSGGAAEAIAIVVRNWPVTTITGRVDLMMTALVYAAMTGSAAAALVLSHSLRQTPCAGERHKRLSASWLARNLRIAAERAAPRPAAFVRKRRSSRGTEIRT